MRGGTSTITWPCHSIVVVAGIVCAFAGLCYAELSSTLPVSGSAYTYGYTTLGEFVAWTMGALLLLEYGLAASVVAVGWGGYVVSLLADFGIHIPAQLTGPAGYTLMKDGQTVLIAANQDTNDLFTFRIGDSGQRNSSSPSV